MPTVLLLDNGRFKVAIYFHDHAPPHVHVLGPGAEARFAIDTLECLSSVGFNATTRNRIKKLLVVHKDLLMEAWNEYQG